MVKAISVLGSEFPVAHHDFYKSNGGDYRMFCSGPSMTRQEFADECNINELMKRYEGHVHGGPGGLPVAGEPVYFDFADLPQDLMGYMAFMADAERQFMSLPAIVRKEFDNDPVSFVGYASDPGSLEQMRKWGLAPPAKVPDAVGALSPPQSPPAPTASPGPSQGPSTHAST